MRKGVMAIFVLLPVILIEVFVVWIADNQVMIQCN